jgi:superfamily II DNA helicase RecQ
MQTDRSITSKIAQDYYHNIVFYTPESFYDNLGQPKPVFKTLAVQNRIGLIAVDEAHLLKAWRTFR